MCLDLWMLVWVRGIIMCKGWGLGCQCPWGSNEKGSPAHLRFATGCPLGWLAAGKRAMCDVGDW